MRSIVGRYLEHTRAFYFLNAGGEPLLYAGSADWMPRNFFRRIEVAFPIDDPALRAWFIDEMFPMELQDNVDARELHPNGAYRPTLRYPAEPSFSLQNHLVDKANQRSRALNAPRLPEEADI